MGSYASDGGIDSWDSSSLLAQALVAQLILVGSSLSLYLGIEVD